MTLNDFHKQAYTAGANQALADFGLAKMARKGYVPQKKSPGGTLKDPIPSARLRAAPKKPLKGPKDQPWWDSVGSQGKRQYEGK
jgi:hypothetical protein